MRWGISATNANGLTVTHAHDGLGRVTTETYLDATTVQRVYGTAGLTSQTDRLGNTTSYTYDNPGHIVTDAVGTTIYTDKEASSRVTGLIMTVRIDRTSPPRYL